MESYDLIIIGGGIGGAASAFRAAQNGMAVAWVLGNKETRARSRSQWVYNLDNMIGFHEGVIKNQVLRTLKRGKQNAAYDLVSEQHYLINNKGIIGNTIERIEEEFPQVSLIHEAAVDVVKTDTGFEVKSESQAMQAPAVILATGMMDSQPAILKKNKKGELRDDPSWIYPYANKEKVLYCIRCEGHLTREERVGVIGSDDTAAEIAFLFKERYKNEVCILTNGEEPDITPERQFLLDHYDIPVYKSRIIDVVNEKKDLRGFQLQDESEGKVYLKFAMVSLGIFNVYNEFAVKVGCDLMNKDKPVNQRYVRVDRIGESSVSNFFVVGDAASRDDEPMMKQVYTAQEYAVRAVDSIDRTRRQTQRQAILKNFQAQ